MYYGLNEDNYNSQILQKYFHPEGSLYKLKKPHNLEFLYSMTTKNTIRVSALSLSTVKVPTIRITAANILLLGYLPLEYLLPEYTQDTACQSTYC